MNTNKNRLHQKIVSLIISTIISITVFSCTYEKADIKIKCTFPDSVSFKNDIIPIFNANCNTSGCHSGNSPAGHLDLSESVAYAQIMHRGSGYVDTIQPEFSILYSSMISKSSPMPPSGNLKDCSQGLLLKWIQQKAKNN